MYSFCWCVLWQLLFQGHPTTSMLLNIMIILNPFVIVLVSLPWLLLLYPSVICSPWISVWPVVKKRSVWKSTVMAAWMPLLSGSTSTSTTPSPSVLPRKQAAAGNRLSSLCFPVISSPQVSITGFFPFSHLSPSPCLPHYTFSAEHSAP